MDISHHWTKVHAMSVQELEKYAEDRQVDISVREFADVQDLADYICEQCGVAKPQSVKSSIA